MILGVSEHAEHADSVCFAIQCLVILKHIQLSTGFGTMVELWLCGDNLEPRELFDCVPGVKVRPSFFI